MHRLNFPFIFISLFLLSSFSLSAHADILVEASLSSHTFAVDQTARLTITITGARSADIEIKKIAGLRFHNRGQSSMVNITNGNYSSSISNSYLVQPLQPGTYTIPPITVIAGKKTVQTEPITFEVTLTDQTQIIDKNSTDTSSSENNVAFIRLSEIGKHYTGEIVPVRIKAYFNQKYRANINSLPALKADGVVMSPLSNEPEQSQEQLKGSIYSVLSWDTTLSGIKIGRHQLLFELDATLLLPSQQKNRSRFGSSPFNDSFFDNFFGSLQRKPIKVTGPELHFEVLDLPSKDRPENFTGAIGNFQLTVNASPTEVEVGEPMTLTIEIAGKGNFDRVEAPLFQVTDDWKTYSPTTDYTSQEDQLSGKKLFEQAIVAKSSSLKQIPSLSFSYFDPQKERYKTITSKPIAVKIAELAVQADPQPPLSTSISKKPFSVQPEAETAAEGIKSLAPLHLATGTFHQSIKPLYRSIWFISAVASCILLLLLVFFFKIRTYNLNKHPELQLQKKRQQLLSDDLAKLWQAKSSENGTHFLSLCRQAIQHQLGLLWQVEGSAICLADIRSRIDGNTALIEIFATAEQAAYGGTELSPETMQTYFEELQKELGPLI